MSSMLKETWQPEPGVKSCIQTEGGEKVYCITTPQLVDKEAIRDQIIQDHNACQGLARVNKIPLLIQNCESLLPLIQ